MGRRKIEMEYLVDDRVRKVTFCKRKGGLFKKADDLSKLCGVEVAVLIVGDNKTQNFATTDLNRIINKFQEINSGQPPPEENESDGLYKKIENQRRDIEALQRQLAEERKKVEALVGGELQMLAVHPQGPSSTGAMMPLPMASGMPMSQDGMLVSAPIVVPMDPIQVPTPVHAVPVLSQPNLDPTALVDDEPAAKRTKVEQVQ